MSASAMQPAPFSDDPICQRLRDAVKSPMTRDQALAGTCDRPVRVYAEGVYDMFHSGHARQLMQAKCAFPNVYLIVGVDSDEVTLSMKGRTVMNESERYEAVRHCRYVDEVLVNPPWIPDEDLIREHKIDFVAHDDLPYPSGGHSDIYGWLKDSDLFVATQRTEGISTTDVITRILRDYDEYVRRNLARGCTTDDLNIDPLRRTLRTTDNCLPKVKQKKCRVQHIKERIVDMSYEMFNAWDQKSRAFVDSFLVLFGLDGRMHGEHREKVIRVVSPTTCADDMSSTNDDRSSSEERQCQPDLHKQCNTSLIGH